MRIMVLGGDGFVGWPTALHLSHAGHEVHIIDDLSRREIANTGLSPSLTPIAPLSDRVRAWNAITTRTLTYELQDVADPDTRWLRNELRRFQPDAVVHLAEQRSAPYSMRSHHHRLLTVMQNINATHGLLSACVEEGVSPHIVHLGTMGVYGYDGELQIPEGYLNVRATGRNGKDVERSIVFPPAPGSIYHMTKVMDHELFQFYARNDGVRITDLHQGIVWGTETEETRFDERLINRFDYDGDYGTVLNRFCMQAVCEHPLTVYGTGGQTRAFIHIEDSVRCIRLAVENPPALGQRPRVFNQMTEVCSVKELAMQVSKHAGVRIEYITNPRREAERNTLDVVNEGLRALGHQGKTLSDYALADVMHVARMYRDRADLAVIRSDSYWNAERAAAARVKP